MSMPIVSNRLQRLLTGSFAPKLGAAILVVPILAAVVLSNAVAAPQTTSPVLAFRVHVLVTDKKVSIKGHSSITLPRGAVIEFLVTNRGTQPYRAQVKLTSNYHFTKYEAKIRSLHSKPIPPDGRGNVRVFFYYRSTFSLQALLDNKPHGASAVIRIV